VSFKIASIAVMQAGFFLKPPPSPLPKRGEEPEGKVFVEKMGKKAYI